MLARRCDVAQPPLGLMRGLPPDVTATYYLQRHAALRADPSRLLPGALRVIAARMDYLPRDTPPDWARRELDRLNEAETAVVSVYARGRDYHKILRERLQKLASRIEAEVGQLGYRVATIRHRVSRSGTGVKGGAGLARQTHASVVARRRVDVFSRRNLDRLAFADRQTSR